MENESLIDGFRSMGYSIDETAEKKVLEVLSGLLDWFKTYETRLLEMEESLKSARTLFSDEFDFVSNAGLKDSVIESWSAIDDFPQDVLLSDIVSVKSGFFAKNGEDESGDTFAELESLSRKFIRASAQSGNRESNGMENPLQENDSGKSGRMEESIWNTDGNEIIVQDDTVGGIMDTLPMMHLRMPLEEFLDMKGGNVSERRDVSPEEAIGVLKAGNDGTGEKDSFLSKSVSGFGSLKASDTNSSVLFSPVYEPDEGVKRPEKTNMSSAGVSLAVAQTGTDKRADIEESPDGIFQSVVDKRFLLEKFFGEDAGPGNLQEKFVSLRQEWIPDRGMHAQKWMDAIRVRQSDSNVLVAYETPVATFKGNMPELADTDSSNRTINITVNGTGSSQETVNAITEGLMEVDMGMTLRHFKSPMMA